MPAPSLSTVHYDGSEIRAQFTYEVPGWSEFRIGLFEGTSMKPKQEGDLPASSPILQNPQMNLTSVWSVRIAARMGQAAGDYSNAIEVIVDKPQDVVLTYDGEALKLNWLPPAGATHVTGALLSLYADGEFVAEATFDAQPGVYRFPADSSPRCPTPSSSRNKQQPQLIWTKPGAYRSYSATSAVLESYLHDRRKARGLWRCHPRPAQPTGSAFISTPTDCCGRR